MIHIRHALEDKIKEIGGNIHGGGSMMIPPYTMDFDFELNGREYIVNLWDKKEKQKYNQDEEEYDLH